MGEEEWWEEGEGEEGGRRGEEVKEGRQQGWEAEVAKFGISCGMQ